MDTQRLQIIIDAQDKASSVISDLGGQLGGINDRLKTLAPAFKTMTAVGAAGFAAVATEIYSAVSASQEAAKAQAQLQAVLTSTHGAAGLFIEDLNDQAQALSQTTTFSDEAVNSLQSMLLTFTNIKGGVFQEATGSILDLATAMGGDLQGASIQVGKALNDPINGITALTRVGVTFSDAQKKTIETLVKTGKTAEAQRVILAELNKEFGGSAAAAAGTFAGKLEILKNNIGEIQERIGNALLPILEQVVEKIVPVVQQVMNWAEQNPKMIITILAVVAGLSALLVVVGTLGLVIPALVAGFGYLATAASILGIAIDIMLGPIGLVILAIGALIAVGVLLYKHWDEVKAFALATWESIRAGIETALNAVMGVMNTVGKAISDAFWIYVDFMLGAWKMLLDFLFPGWEQALSDIWNAAQVIFGQLVAFIQTQMSALINFIRPILAALRDTWNSIWNSMRDVFGAVWDSIKAVAGAAFDWIKSGIDTLMKPLNDLIDLAQKAFNAAKSAVGSVGGAISNATQSVINTGKSITGRATGGPVGPDRPHLVGENGPELFMPNTAGRITSAGGSTIVLNITGNTFMGEEDIAERIGNDIIDILKRTVKL